MFAPGSRPELLKKAQLANADALIFDLEDSVALNAKDAARENVRATLSEGCLKPLFVRINNPRAGDYLADIRAIEQASSHQNLMGVILPKAESVQDIVILDKALKTLESSRAMKEGSIRILPLIETCMGLRNTFDLASASPRICGVSLASAEQGDFMLDLGGHWTTQSLALLYPRSKMILDARAAGLQWIVDGVFMNLSNLEALKAECKIARELGCVGKMAIHPTQLPIMHEVFTPSAQEVEYARGLLEAFKEAESKGQGAVRYQNMMIDYANVRLAQRTLSLAGLN